METILLRGSWVCLPNPSQDMAFRSLRKPKFPTGATLGTLRSMNTGLHSHILACTHQIRVPQHLYSPRRDCSPLCNPLSCASTPEALPSLVSLGCAGGCPPLGVAGSASPFPFLTALLSLVNTLGQIHKGLCRQVSLR